MTEVEFLAVGGNRHPSAADWAPGLLVYGAGNNVGLWNPQDHRQNGVYAILSGHTDTVTALKIWDHGEQRSIVSGSADTTVRIWTSKAVSPGVFEQQSLLTGHQSSINAISVLSGNALMCSGSADGTVRLWDLTSEGAPSCAQTITLKPRILPLTVTLASLANGQTVLAVAGTSASIQLYVQPNRGAPFELQATLTGHEGWIRSLDFVCDGTDQDADLILASASQDKFVRLWRFRQHKAPIQGSRDDEFESHSQSLLSNKTHQVGFDATVYAVTFEALLIGHEDWIYSVRWAPQRDATGQHSLLSASADNSLAIWNADPASGVWICETRLGEISAQKGSTTATGSTGGFWIGLWQPDAQSVVSLGRTGSWRRWVFDQTQRSWRQRLGIGGHVDEVRGVCWSTDGGYLLSTSADQTTRLWAEWQRDGMHSWHEMTRPQIHGYDLICVASLHPNQFISGADEKLLRVFNKPKAVNTLLARLSGLDSIADDTLPDAANVPVLGLSNKAISAVDHDELAKEAIDPLNTEPSMEESDARASTSTLDLQSPPLEDHLARHTLWPEHEKLYGHGYEISAVSASHGGLVVATACKATSIDHAVIRLFEQKEWREIKPPLTAHSLTVTSLEFSDDDRYLLSVGRDRQWAIFERAQQEGLQYKPLIADPKGHARMILDCSWAPSSAGRIFATAGRDKTVKLWNLSGPESRPEALCIQTVHAENAVTAVAFEPAISQSGELRLAYGTDDGHLVLVTLLPDRGTVLSSVPVTSSLRAGKAITALAWRPQRIHNVAAQLAVASEDHAVSVYRVASEQA